MRRLLGLLAGVAFLAALGLAGTSDFHDQLREAVLHCDMVKAGHWPNYNGTDCEKVHAEAAEYLIKGN